MARPTPASVVLIVAALSAAGDPSADYRSATHKLALIEAELVPPGSRVHFSGRELNAYVRAKARSVLPEGLRNPRLELGHGRATGTALVDFARLRKGGGRPLDRLLRWLLEGERPVRVDAILRSSSGMARVELERVEISGLAVRGPALDFLIEHFLLPRYPEARIGEPFELKHRIERLEVEPGGVSVFTKN